MLLHELQHYKHKDAFANHLMNLAGILYWFNPFVWSAPEGKCRSTGGGLRYLSVLELLGEKIRRLWEHADQPCRKNLSPAVSFHRQYERQHEAAEAAHPQHSFL